MARNNPSNVHDLLQDLPRGNLANERSPNTRFADPAVIKELEGYRFNENKLWLGVIDGQVHEERLEHGRLTRYVTGGQPIGISTDYHHTTIAGTRSGKGRAAIIPTLLTYKGSCLVIDIKGELATITANRRQEMGQTVHVLDPFGVANVDENLRKSFNPIDIIADGANKNIIEDAELISDSLIIDSGGDKHWDDASRGLLSGVALHIATHRNYVDLRDLVTVREFIAKLNEDRVNEMKANPSANLAVEYAAHEFWDKTEGERQSVLSTTRRHLRFLGYEAMQSALRGTSIDLKELKRKPTTIYLCLPAMRMSTCFAWFRLFVNQALAAMESEQTKPDVPVLFILDEANVLQNLRSLQIAAGQLAGFSVKLWTIWQSIGQIKSNYQDHYESFLSGVLQFFGNSDVTTLEWISKRLGQTTIKTPSQADVSLDDATQKGLLGISLANQVHSLMTAEEISRHFGRDDAKVRQLIINPSFAPMILQRAYYDKHELLKSHLPPELLTI